MTMEISGNHLNEEKQSGSSEANNKEKSFIFPSLAMNNPKLKLRKQFHLQWHQ